MQQVECEAPELGCAEATLPTRCGAPAVGTLLWCTVRTAASAPLPARLCTAADRDGSAQGRGSAVHPHTRANPATAASQEVDEEVASLNGGRLLGKATTVSVVEPGGLEGCRVSSQYYERV